MSDRARWLELAAYGTDGISFAAAGWYLFARSVERDRRSANRRLAEFNELKKRVERNPADRSLSDSGRSPAGPETRQPLPDITLLAGRLEDRGGEGIEAEELLAARMLKFDKPFLDPVLDAVLGWWGQIWRRMGILGWFRVPMLAPAGLVLFALVAVIFVILLPVAAIGYLLDGGNDFRLRIVVLVFALGLVLQAIRATIG